MNRQVFRQRAGLLIIAAILLAAPPNFTAGPPVPVQPNVSINGFFSADKAQRGHIVQAAVVMDIPEGFHVNANRPLGKYAIPTTLKVEAPNGIKISPVNFPPATVRHFSFTKEQLAVYEGRTIMRFNVTVPANQEVGVNELRVKLHYQSCNNEVCFPPVTREITLPIAVVNANEPVKRINSEIFGGGRRTNRHRRRR